MYDLTNDWIEHKVMSADSERLILHVIDSDFNIWCLECSCIQEDYTFDAEDSLDCTYDLDYPDKATNINYLGY